MKKYTILLVDQYDDMPSRGLLGSGEDIFAFEAKEFDYESATGPHMKIRVFGCSPELIAVMKEKKAIFRVWRELFDQKLVDVSTHPLYVNKRFQELAGIADEAFKTFESPLIEVLGNFGAENGTHFFECLD